MEMDWGTAIFGLLSMLAIIVPFVIIHYKKEKKRNNMLHTLKETAQQHQGNISQHEFCGDFGFGIDEVRSFVFFLKQKQAEVISQFIDLREIQSCRIEKKTRDTHQSSSLNSILKLDLCFLPANHGKTETRFELYDEAINRQLSGELQFADKWSKQINDRLNNKKK